jgi:hypothetical protein
MFKWMAVYTHNNKVTMQLYRISEVPRVPGEETQDGARSWLRIVTLVELSNVGKGVGAWLNETLLGSEAGLVIECSELEAVPDNRADEGTTGKVCDDVDVWDLGGPIWSNEAVAEARTDDGASTGFGVVKDGSEDWLRAVEARRGAPKAHFATSCHQRILIKFIALKGIASGATSDDQHDPNLPI